MKAAATPEVTRVLAQPIINTSGLKKIPPPTPVSPDINPIRLPPNAIPASGAGLTATSFRAN